MVTKEGSVKFMPDEWKAKIRELAAEHNDTGAGGDAYDKMVSDIETLVDTCVTEAVLTLMAEMEDGPGRTQSESRQ